MILRTGGAPRYPVAGLFALVALLPGCRFEIRAPQGSIRDEAAVQGVAAGFYRSLARQDTTGLDTLTLGAATVLLATPQAKPSLIAWRALLGLPERRTSSTGVRLVRTELRLDGDMASARAIVAAQDLGDAGEFEASDLLTFARRDGQWRVAHAVLGAWRPRTAP